MSRQHLMWYMLAATLVAVACQPPPKRVRRDVNLACFSSLGIHRHLERPSSWRVLNIQEQRERNQYLQLSRHHIIPYATMRDFYNTMLGRDQAAFVRLFNDVLYPAAASIGIVPELGALSYEEFRLPVLEELTGTYLRIRTVDQVRIIQEVYAWLPFNIYIGPTPGEREDDSQANVFDETARPIVGNEQADQLRRLYEAMSRYIASIRSVSVNSIIDTMADLVHLRQVPYDFVPSQWRVRSGINEFRFTTATEAVRNNESAYRQLRAEDYCRLEDQPTTPASNTHDPGDLRRKRHLAGDPKKCILLENNDDAFCLNTLDNVRELIKDGTFKLIPIADEGVDVEICNLGSNCYGDNQENVFNVDKPDPSLSATPTDWLLGLMDHGMWPQKG